MAGFYSSKEFGTTTESYDFTGKGLSLEGLFKYGKIQINKGVSRIEQSIQQILITPKGTRFFIPEFGSMLYSIVHEPNDFIIADLAQLYVREAIAEWEPRVQVTEVQTDSHTNPNILYINIIYKILSTNSFENYVYALNRSIKDI